MNRGQPEFFLDREKFQSEFLISGRAIPFCAVIPSPAKSEPWYAVCVALVSKDQIYPLTRAHETRTRKRIRHRGAHWAGREAAGDGDAAARYREIARGT